jgi:hypothetical protein
MLTSCTVVGVQPTTEGSPLISALSGTFTDGSDIAIERSHHFEDDGGEAICEDETFFYDSVRVGSDETNDWLTGCSRADPVAHAAGTFVQAGADAERKKVARVFYEDENDKHRVEISENVSQAWPLGAYTEDQYRSAVVESDEQGFAEVVTAPLSEPWAIENVVAGQAGPTYGAPYRFRLDERGFFVWDENDNQLIALDAENLSHLLVGTFRNALEGTHWEISSSDVNLIQGYLDGFEHPGQITVGPGQDDAGFLGITSPGSALLSARSSLLLYGAIGGASKYAQWSTGEIELLQGNEAHGYCAWRQPAAEVLGTQNRGYGVMYGGVSKTQNTPSGITFTTVGTDANVASATAQDITNRGFRFAVAATATGVALEAKRTFVTVGN